MLTAALPLEFPLKKTLEARFNCAFINATLIYGYRVGQRLFLLLFNFYTYILLPLFYQLQRFLLQIFKLLFFPIFSLASVCRSAVCIDFQPC